MVLQQYREMHPQLDHQLYKVAAESLHGALISGRKNLSVLTSVKLMVVIAAVLAASSLHLTQHHAESACK